MFFGKIDEKKIKVYWIHYDDNAKPMTIRLEMSIVKLVSIIRSNPDGGRRGREKRVKKEEREREHQKGKYNL